MQKTPDILKHKGILTHWSDYPEGSIERAKSLGIEVLATAKGLQTTLELWQTELRVLQKEKPWKVLGLKNADEYVKAIIGKSTKEIGKEISKRTQIRKLREENPDWTQQQIADQVGVTKGYVSQVFSEKSESDNLLNPPSHLSSRTDQADFRKLPEELREQVTNNEISLNAAAIKAGVRKKKTPEELTVANFRKSESRLVPLRIIVGELEPHEAVVVRDWINELLESAK